jgi:YVTN family beta-propeller protein
LVTRLCIPAALLSLTLASPPHAASSGIYVTNTAGDNISVIDPETNKVVQEISGVEASRAVDFSADGKYVFVSVGAEDVLGVADRQSAKIVKTIPLSGPPDLISVTKDGKYIYIAISKTPGIVDVIDAKSLEKIRSISLKDRPHYVHALPDKDYIIVTSVPGKTVIAINPLTGATEWEMKFDRGIRPMAFEKGADGKTHRMFMELSEFSGFAVIDLDTHTEIQRIALPDAPNQYGIAEGRSLVPCHGIGIAPDGKTLWVNSTLNNSVYAYSLPDLRMLARVPLPELKLPGRPVIPSVPEWITFAADSKRVYVSNSGLDSVSVIDIKNLKEVAVVPVGDVPKHLNAWAPR